MSNLNINRINLTYSEADIAQMKNNAFATMAKIPTGTTLTDQERATGTDINVNNKVFVEDALKELNFNGTEIMPAWVNATNLSKDLTFFEQSDELITIYSNLLRRLKDAQRVAGREAYAAALNTYHLYKEAADSGVPGAKTSYDHLKIRISTSTGDKRKYNP